MSQEINQLTSSFTKMTISIEKFVKTKPSDYEEFVSAINDQYGFMSVFTFEEKFPKIYKKCKDEVESYINTAKSVIIDMFNEVETDETADVLYELQSTFGLELIDNMKSVCPSIYKKYKKGIQEYAAKMDEAVETVVDEESEEESEETPEEEKETEEKPEEPSEKPEEEPEKPEEKPAEEPAEEPIKKPVNLEKEIEAYRTGDKVKLHSVLSRHTVPVLKELIKLNGLVATGKKGELIETLIAFVFKIVDNESVPMDETEDIVVVEEKSPEVVEKSLAEEVAESMREIDDAKLSPIEEASEPNDEEIDQKVNAIQDAFKTEPETCSCNSINNDPIQMGPKTTCDVCRVKSRSPLKRIMEEMPTDYSTEPRIKRRKSVCPMFKSGTGKEITVVLAKREKMSDPTVILVNGTNPHDMDGNHCTQTWAGSIRATMGEKAGQEFINKYHIELTKPQTSEQHLKFVSEQLKRLPVYN